MTGAPAFAHVLWIGGGTAAGKTTVARLLAAKHGIECYECDRAEHAQVRRVEPGRSPHLHRWLGLSMDERWVHPSPGELARTTLRVQEDFFPLILEDLGGRLPRPVVVEGFGLRPDLVAPLLPTPRHAVWLLPTPAFRERALHAAGRARAMPDQTSDPPRALSNRLARDRLLTEHARREARRLGLRVIEVDGSHPPDAIAAEVEEHFAPALREHAAHAGRVE